MQSGRMRTVHCIIKKKIKMNTTRKEESGGGQTRSERVVKSVQLPVRYNIWSNTGANTKTIIRNRPSQQRTQEKKKKRRKKNAIIDKMCNNDFVAYQRSASIDIMAVGTRQQYSVIGRHVYCLQVLPTYKSSIIFCFLSINILMRIFKLSWLLLLWLIRFWKYFDMFLNPDIVENPIQRLKIKI